MNSFGEMGQFNVVAISQISNGAGNAQYSMKTACTPAKLGRGALQKLSGGFIQLAQLIKLFGGELLVGTPLTRDLSILCSPDLSSNGFTAF